MGGLAMPAGPPYSRCVEWTYIEKASYWTHQEASYQSHDPQALLFQVRTAATNRHSQLARAHKPTGMQDRDGK